MCHLLIVEDHRLLRDLLETYLKEEGYSVTVFYDGAAAQRALQSETFDAVIVDAVLPCGVSGLDVAHIARERGIPVLVTSGWPATIAKMSAEPYHFLGKPFHPAQLKAALQVVLSANHNGRDVMEPTYP